MKFFKKGTSYGRSRKISQGMWCVFPRDDRREPKVDMLEHYPELKSMYSPDDDNTETLYFKDATATFYSFTAAPRTVKF